MLAEASTLLWRAPHPAAIIDSGDHARVRLNESALSRYGGLANTLSQALATLPEDGLLSGVGLPVHAQRVALSSGAVIGYWLSDTPAALPAHVANFDTPMVMALAGVSAWLYDLATQALSWNHEAYVLLGLDPARHTLPASVEDAYTFVHPDDHAVLQQARDAALAQEGAVAARCRFRRHDGAWRHGLTRRLALRDAQGVPRAVLGIVIDISDAADTEAALLRMADRLRLATAAAHIGIWDWDLKTNQQEWDDHMRRIYGVGAAWETTSLDAWYALLHPRDAEDALDDMLTSARTGAPYESAFRIIRPDGQVRHLIARGTIYNDAQGKPARMVGVDWDVTDRRRAEQTANEALDRLQLATNAAGIGIWEHDLRASASVWSPQMYTLFGAEDRLGENPQTLWRQALLDDDRPLLADAKRRAMLAREPYQTEFRIRTSAGEIRWLAARGLMQFDELGQPVRLVGVNWDITEERRTAEAMQAKEAAERANRAKSEFLSRMSHELRTPLNGILGFAQLLATDEQDPLGEDQRARLRRIEDAGWHLLALINDLLDLSRIESGALVLKPVPVCVDLLAEEVVSMLAHSAAGRQVDVTLTKRITGGEFAVADEVRLRQVLTNLVSNAIKYNRPGGSVTIQSYRASDTTVGISVHDTGLGLTREQREHLFEPFNRLGRESSDTQGTGIGLVIAKGLIEQMGGGISVESTAGVGTCFRIWLPVAATCADPPPAPLPRAPVETRADIRGTVIYIEDNPLNAMVVEEYLHYRPGVRFFHAPDGTRGLELLAQHGADLLLVDMNLPDVNGLEVLQRARARDLRATHCVVLSANVLPADIERARAGGFDDYWTKPVTISDFLRGVDRLLSTP